LDLPEAAILYWDKNLEIEKLSDLENSVVSHPSRKNKDAAWVGQP
jgi:hypothetical protein